MIARSKAGYVLYESARIVLEWIRPLLQDGTVLMFNDFYRFKGQAFLVHTARY